LDKWTENRRKNDHNTPSPQTPYGVFFYAPSESAGGKMLAHVLRALWKCVGAAILCSNLSLFMWCGEFNLQFLGQKRTQNEFYK